MEDELVWQQLVLTNFQKLKLIPLCRSTWFLSFTTKSMRQYGSFSPPFFQLYSNCAKLFHILPMHVLLPWSYKVKIAKER